MFDLGALNLEKLTVPVLLQFKLGSRNFDLGHSFRMSLSSPPA